MRKTQLGLKTEGGLTSASNRHCLYVVANHGDSRVRILHLKEGVKE